MTYAIYTEWKKTEVILIYDGGYSEEMFTMDFERDCSSESEDDSYLLNEKQRKFFSSKFKMIDYQRLRNSNLISNKEFIIRELNCQNCSICLEVFKFLDGKIVRLPGCQHIFHWKYLIFNII